MRTVGSAVARWVDLQRRDATKPTKSMDNKHILSSCTMLVDRTHSMTCKHSLFRRGDNLYRRLLEVVR